MQLCRHKQTPVHGFALTCEKPKGHTGVHRALYNEFLGYKCWDDNGEPSLKGELKRDGTLKDMPK